MRDYFQQLLNNLETLTGMKQLERISQKANADNELNTLLDVLCKVSDLFPYIPDDAKKNIISDSVITDQEFIGLNAKIIYKWLNLRKDIYFKEIAHKNSVEVEPVTGEKRDEWLNIWQQTLAKMEDNFTVKPVTNAEILREKFHGKDAKPTNYKPISEEEVEKKRLHSEYLRENYDPISGNCLETWMPEDEWIKKQSETKI